MREECASIGIIFDGGSSHVVSCALCRDENTGADETDEAASNKDKQPRGGSNIRYWIVIGLIAAYLRRGYLIATEAEISCFDRDFSDTMVVLFEV